MGGKCVMVLKNGYESKAPTPKKKKLLPPFVSKVASIWSSDNSGVPRPFEDNDKTISGTNNETRLAKCHFGKIQCRNLFPISAESL